jgi:hypothetical protein
MSNLKYIGKNVLNHDLEVKNGNIIGDHTEVIRVTVVSDGGNKYAFEGATTPDFTIDEGKTYRFDQSDSTNETHPLRFSIVENGTWGGGSAYTTGVTTHGTAGFKGAYTEINVTKVTPNHLYYYCVNHSGMGNDALLLKNDFSNLYRISGSDATVNVSQVTASGVQVNGNVTVNDDILVGEYIRHKGDLNTRIYFTDDRLRFQAGGLDFAGMHKKVSTPHLVTINNGSNNIDFQVKDNSNNILFRTDADEQLVKFPDALQISGSSVSTGSFGRLETPGNISSSGQITGNIVNVKTRVKAIGSSLEFAGNTLDFVDGSSTSRFFKGTSGGAFEAYHAGNKKLETTSTGISITGNVLSTGNVSGSSTSTGSFGTLETSDVITVGANKKIYLNRSEDTYIQSMAGDIARIVAGGNQMLLLDYDTGNRAVFGNGTKVYIGADNNKQPDKELVVDGDVSGSGTGSFGLVEVSGIDIDPTGVSRDQVLKFNGTNFVPAAFDDTFVFTIADFDMNDSTSTQLIGSGSWKAIGALTFTATYNNGPPDGFEGSSAGAPKIQGYVNSSISSSYDMFPLSSSFSTGTNPMVITYPLTTGHDIRFRLFASAGSDTDNEYTDQRIYFRNQFVYGDLSKNNGFNQADIRTLAAANTVTTNDTTRTLSVSVGGSNYLCFAHRTGDTNVAQVRAGTGTNILTVAMDRTDVTALTPLKETVSYLNTAGFTENFYVYASAIANVDAHSTTFTTVTSTQKKNYFIWGYDSQADSYDESFLETSGDWDSYNKNSSYDDGTVTGQTLSVGSFTSKYVIIAFPDRYGDNETNFQFKDNSTSLPFDVTAQDDVTVTNAVGFQETYHVWRSTNLLTMTNLTVLIDSV